MALERVSFGVRTRAEYEAKRQRIFSEIRAGERVSNGMIYCRKCYQPKVYDDPERRIVTRCACTCEVEAWERERRGCSAARRTKSAELRAGDWNPFDGGAR